MRRYIFPILLAALLISVVQVGAALAQQTPTPVPLVAPPGPATHFPTRFDVVDAPEQFDQVLMIIDFPSGTWTPPHTPGGYVYATVIEGEISSRIVGTSGQDTTYQAGGTYIETPGEYVEVGNAGPASARVMATAMLPKGAPLAINQDGVSIDAYPALTDGVGRPPGPVTVHRSSIAVDRPAGAFELVQLLLDFKPGISTPQHMHGGQELAMVTTGEMTLQRSGDVELFGAGESWVNTAGLVHSAGNDGTDFAQVVATFLLPAGRPLTTVI